MQVEREVVRFLSAYQTIWHVHFPLLFRRAQWHIVTHLCTIGRDGAAVGELYGLVKQVFLLDDSTVKERILEIGSWTCARSIRRPERSPREPSSSPPRRCPTSHAASPPACRMAWRHHPVIVQPQSAARRIALTGSLTIGRAPPNGLLPEGSEVSRAHCRIDVAGDEVSVTNLNSTILSGIGGPSFLLRNLLPRIRCRARHRPRRWNCTRLP